MLENQDSVTRVLSVLSHPIRREILLNLSDKGELSFTDLLNLLTIDTGKLSFHLRNLPAFIEQTSSGKYTLSRAGESAVRIIHDIASWADSADVQGKVTQLSVASLKKRVSAFIIDLSLITAITFLITIIPELIIQSGDLIARVVSATIFVTIGLMWLYSTLLEGFNGQSIGKRLVGLKVVRTDGKKMSYDHAAVRNFGKLLPLLPFDLLVGWRLKNVLFRRYFDKFSGTTVIDLRQ
ncbi:MAG: RDD family protein [Candidatus Bathyarchaeota archaeon]|nr:RDD family protein [Candidatus Bathyarchaeota archaeon]